LGFRPNPAKHALNLTVSFSHPPTACDVAADSTDTWAAS
jgi:hypothetical protein